jgi:hypothetical protein
LIIPHSLFVELLNPARKFIGNPGTARISAHRAEMANPHAGLLDNLKFAQDCALEGLYDTCIIFFDSAIDHINR